jgi:uroporphyrinogen decarboxylase
MAYKKGPFFSLRSYRNLIYNGHKKIFMTYRNRNLPVVLHCDGNFRALIPDLINAGVSALEPLEVKSGIDVRELKEKYGDHLAFIGNIDKRMLSGNLDQLRNEVLSKLKYAAPGGGYILGSDHSVPPTVSLTNYSYMIKLVKKYGRYK